MIRMLAASHGPPPTRSSQLCIASTRGPWGGIFMIRNMTDFGRALRQLVLNGEADNRDRFGSK